ncbi:MAG: phosphoglycerate dehydrogenase [Anaerolineae bacterium]|nr:phosphoglycerate dehydrogenase [Thermoflexus sp.]MDW8065186.1 phosphoglycerate dehydrogenase [Anaerolineae bacterium]
MVWRIGLTDALDEEGLALLRGDPEVEVIEARRPPLEMLQEMVRTCDALIVRSGIRLDARVLEHAERLRVIARAGIGVDNIDLEAATHRGILVMNNPGASTIAVAEHTFALLLAVLRKIPQAWLSLREGRWERERFMGFQLAGKTMGLIGLGRIGTEVARRARAFEMHVIAFDPYIPEERAVALQIELVPDLDELFARADVISLHVPLTRETHHLIGRSAFEKMKPGVVLVNTARGAIVDEGALLEALDSGRVAGAALDTFSEEPPRSPILQALIAHERVVAVPHLGGSTREAQRLISRQIVQQVLDALRGRDYRNVVNLPFPEGADYRALAPFMRLAEVIGRLQTQMVHGRIYRAEIDVRGEELRAVLRPLGVAFLKGLLTPILGDEVTFVNAPILARERGIQITEAAQPILGAYAQAIACRVVSTRETRLIVGALFAGEPRIVQVDDLPMEALPRGAVLVMRSRDVPGVIGRVGTWLGQHGINIAEWRLGRDHPGGTALSFINLDSPASPEVLEMLQAMPEVEEVRQVFLPEN